MSVEQDYVNSLLSKMIALKKSLGYFAKKKLDGALKDWWRENKLRRYLLNEVMNDLDDIED